MGSMSLLVREFDNLCSDASQVAMDLPSKMGWQMQVRMSQERTCERDATEITHNQTS